jgi:hypothetical protein
VINAAIVGLGRWGRTLVNSVQGKSSAIRFTAGHNRTRASAEAFCAENGIALKDDLEQILADPAIDGVVFATPHSQHGAQVELTAAAGKHVFMEKPFTLDVKSAEAAIDAVTRAGVVLAVAYPRSVSPGDDRAEGTDSGRPSRHRQPLRERAGIADRALDGSELLAVRPARGAGRGDDRDRRAQSRCNDLSVRQNR